MPRAKKAKYDNGVAKPRQSTVTEESTGIASPRVHVYGAVITLEPRVIDVLRDAVSPEDAAELIKERRVEVLDLGEHWHGLHWLLARRSDADPDRPLTWAVLGRTLLPEIDRGWGAPGIVQPGDMAAVADALKSFGAKTARLRFDAEAMDQRGIYPTDWRNSAVRPHHLLSHLGPLTALYRRAVRRGVGAVGYRY